MGVLQYAPTKTMAWFKKEKNKASKTVKVPEGLWVKCNSCKEIIYRKEVDRNLKVCPKCNYHFRISAKERISLLAEDGSFTEFAQDMSSRDPLSFKDQVTYKERLKGSQQKTTNNDAATAGKALRPRIVSKLSGPVTTLRADADVVITEYGMAELRGKTLVQRAEAMIAIAHPDHRAELRQAIDGLV